MGITNTLGLLGLLAVPIIIVLYMLRPKNKPQPVPSLYLWRQMQEEIEKAVRIKKLKTSILMFIQIMVVLLMVLILAGFFITGKKEKANLLLIIDASYTMQSADLGQSRMDRAKEEARAYLRGLDDGSLVTLMVAEDVPKTLAKDEENLGIILSYIEQIHAVDGICSMEILEQTLESIREPGQDIVYIGDRSLKGAGNIRTLASEKNYSLHEITYTKYLKEGTITALTEVFNHDSQSGLIQISLYVDDKYFATKQVEIGPKERGKLFFEDIPYETEILHVAIDNEDILEGDNHAYQVIQSDKVQKVLLITDGNSFLEKALGLHPNVEVYTGEDVEGLYGYDLYVYDGLEPSEYPDSGAYMLFNPSQVPGTELLGYAENPVVVTADHKITDHIENPEFATRVSGVFDVVDKSKIIYDTNYGAVAFETLINDNRALVYGFDIQDTNMPLSIEFPILMMNSLDYLLSNRMVENRSYYVGENLEVSILPSGNKGQVVTPGGVSYPLTFERKTQVMPVLLEAGIYEVVQENNFDVWSESFAVNYPKQFLDQGEIGDGENIDLAIQNKDLNVLLGLVIIGLLGLEWLIYDYRRKIHEY